MVIPGKGCRKRLISAYLYVVTAIGLSIGKLKIDLYDLTFNSSER